MNFTLLKGTIMKFSLLPFVIFFFTAASFSQSSTVTKEFNFGLEKVSPYKELPDDWLQWGTGYSLSIDSVQKHTGNNSVLIKPSKEKPPNSFGSIGYVIPAIYEGKEIELRAWMKFTDVMEGTIGLMLRIDGSSGMLQFDNMMQKNIQGTSDWKMYSVKLPLPDNAKTIYIGAILSGTGQLWVDDFEILIDGTDISTVKQKEQKVYKAEMDKEFDKGSKIESLKLTDGNVQDLSLLGMVWGFLKYYHPNIAKGEYNWDYELFRILPKIIQAKNINERDSILCN
ncbi:MAG: peptidase [Ignavibacteria bacterium]|nr:peptidase [Ignavibacteria bacterium]